MGQERIGWAKMAAVLVAARFCEPSSELHIAEDWYRRTALGDLLQLSDEAVNKDRLYRALDRTCSRTRRPWRRVCLSDADSCSQSTTTCCSTTSPAAISRARPTRRGGEGRRARYGMMILLPERMGCSKPPLRQEFQMADMSPLRRRMIEDMTIRILSPATQQSYVHAVSKFSRYFGRSPDRLGLEDVRAYQVHLISKGISWASLNQVVCALRFFYGVRSAATRSRSGSPTPVSRASCRPCSAPMKSFAFLKPSRVSKLASR